MRDYTIGDRCRHLTAARACAMGLAVCSGMAMTLPGSEAQAVEVTSQRHAFDIPAASLDAALLVFAEQAGVQVVMQSRDVKGWRSQPIVGSLSAEEALRKLVNGTPLDVRWTGPKTVLIHSAKSTEAAYQTESPPVSQPTQAPGDVADAGRLEEIVVTAQKRAESMQEVPVTLTVITGAALADFGISDTQRLANATPGLVVTNTGGFNQPYIRGVGTRFASAGLESSIATYVDDQYVARITSSLYEFNDIERVEVLKGPQGTLFGRNAAGGAIRVITKDVSDILEGSGTLTLGNFSTRSIKGFVNVPVTEKLGARFSVLAKERDGYVKNISERSGVHDELDDQDLQEYRAKVRWAPTEQTDAVLSFAYTRRKDTNGLESNDIGPFSAGLARGGRRGTGSDEVALDLARGDLFDGIERRGELRIEHDFGLASLTSISTWSNSKVFNPVDSDGTDAEVSTSYSYDHDYQNFSQEFQLASSAEGPLNWLIGLYYFDEALDFESDVAVGAPTRLSTGNSKLDTRAYAAFGQATWRISDQWSLTLGGRYSKEEKDVTQRASTHGLPTIYPNLPFRLDDEWSSFTPKATLSYKQDDLMLYATYARGFKSGGFNTPAVGSSPLDPEILDMYEMGLKSEFFNHRLRVNGAVYYYDYEDLQVTRTTQLPGGIISISTENAASAAAYGLDLEASWLMAENTSLTFGLGLMDSEFKNYDALARVFDSSLLPAASSRAVAFDADGHSLLRAPEETFFVELSHTFTLKNGGSIPADLNYAWKGAYYFDFIADPPPGNPRAEALRTDSYGLLGARISYVTAGERWRVSAWGNNLTDKEYPNDIILNAPGLRIAYGDPRTYGVDVTFSF